MNGTEPLYTAAEMRAAEATYDGPTIDLMERAGEAVAVAVVRRYPDARRISVWCGTGANGGDGLVAARYLHEAGKSVELLVLGDRARIAGDAAENLRRAGEIGLEPASEPAGSDVIVDALFGTGFSGAPRREAAAVFEAINASGDPVVSVDVPSGIDASSGRVDGAAVRAGATVTFHGRKVGLAIAPGRFLTGEVEVADIGIEHVPTELVASTAALLDGIPRRRSDENKYSAGAVLVVGGSTGTTGAPCMSALAALRAGAGVVFACVPSSIRQVAEQHLLEVMVRPGLDDDHGRLVPEAADEILALADRASAVAVGPGLGRSDGTRELVRILLERLELPVVVDADGLWALVGHLEWVFSRDAPTVLTPHSGELGRLLSRESARIDARRLDAAQAGADDTGAVVLLKGADTIVAAPGRSPIVSDLGNPGLASAGSGDVLTGIVAAFLSKGVEPRLAAVAAATAQGLAANRVAEQSGWAGMIASDVIGVLSRTLSWQMG